MALRKVWNNDVHGNVLDVDEYVHEAPSEVHNIQFGIQDVDVYVEGHDVHANLYFDFHGVSGNTKIDLQLGYKDIKI